MIKFIKNLLEVDEIKANFIYDRLFAHIKKILGITTQYYEPEIIAAGEENIKNPDKIYLSEEIMSPNKLLKTASYIIEKGGSTSQALTFITDAGAKLQLIKGTSVV